MKEPKETYEKRTEKREKPEKKEVQKKGKKKRTLAWPHIAAFYLHFVFIDQQSANISFQLPPPCLFAPATDLFAIVCIIYGQLKAFTCEQF